MKNMTDLESIGFYTLCNARAESSWADTSLSRCEIVLTAKCNFKCPYCRHVGGSDLPFGDALKTITMQSAQMVKKKQQELLVTQQEAQKIVKQAEAEREALVQKATGERDAALLRAEAKQAEGDGIRKYNEAIAKNMAQEVEFRKLAIEQTKAERWNGQQVSTNNYGPIPVQTGSIVK